jgi:hypothetical protein
VNIINLRDKKDDLKLGGRYKNLILLTRYGGAAEWLAGAGGVGLDARCIVLSS